MDPIHIKYIDFSYCLWSFLSIHFLLLIVLSSIMAAACVNYTDVRDNTLGEKAR